MEELYRNDINKSQSIFDLRLTWSTTFKNCQLQNLKLIISNFVIIYIKRIA